MRFFRVRQWLVGRLGGALDRCDRCGKEIHVGLTCLSCFRLLCFTCMPDEGDDGSTEDFFCPECLVEKV